MEKNHWLGDESMVIDVDKYVDHFYIHYHKERAQHLLGPAITYHQEQMRNLLQRLQSSGMNEAQAQGLVDQMNQNLPQAQASAQIIKALNEDSSLLPTTLDQIADIINKHINSSNFGDIVDSAYSYKGVLEAGASQDIGGFFELIQKGLLMINNAPDKDQLYQLSILQQVFEGNAGTPELELVQPQGLSIAAQIIRYLKNAAERFTQGNGKLTARSFSSTIANIFSRTLGEEMAKIMIQNALESIQQQADQAVDKAMMQINGSNLGGKLSWAKGSPQSSETGTLKTENSKRTAKVDVVSNGLFRLTVNINGKDTIIEIATNASVKWQTKKKKQIHIVSNFPLSRFLDKQDANVQHWDYNILAHRKSGKNFTEAYNSLRGHIAASFFNEWLTGTGEGLINPSGQLQGIDRAQFLMYNGKIYAVSTIINNLVEESMSKYAAVSGFTVKESTNINKWLVGQGDDNWDMANYRSGVVRDVINALTVSANFNTSLLP